MRRTVAEHDMLAGVDRLGVAVSGGADSLAMLDLLVEIVDGSPVGLVPFYVRQYEHIVVEPLVLHVKERHGLALRVIEAPADEAAAKQQAAGRAPCRSCSAIRASAIARLAKRDGLTTVALGHHMTDAVATLLLNMWHEVDIDTMRPVTVRRRGGRVRIVRPLYDVPEARVKAVSPAPAGIVDCGMCSRTAESRAVTTQYVNDVIARNPGAAARMARLLDDVHARPSTRR